MARLAVIIPTLNEAEALPALLGDLRAQAGIRPQIIVADGGSRDATPRIAREAGAVLLSAPRGRGAQMNAGRKATDARWLLFLHADSRLPTPRLLHDALRVLARARLGGGLVAGHFPLRFADAPAAHQSFYRHLEGKTRLNRPYTINGDQGLLIAAADFDALGGYDTGLPFLEDQRIAARIFARGRWLLLPGELHSSARRFEAEGRSARYTLMAILMGLHAAGVHEFFEQAPQLYAVQADTNTLDLAPFLALADRLLQQMPLRQRLRTLYRVGRFVRENAWQIPYFLDTRAGRDALPLLRQFDRHLAPWLDQPAADAAAAALTYGWFRYLLTKKTGRRSAPF